MDEPRPEGSSPKEPPPEEEPLVKVLWDTEPPAVAVDWAWVNSQGWGQFSVVLCAISPEIPVPSEGQPILHARIVASARMPTLAFLGITRLMARQWNQYARGLPKGTLLFEEKEKADDASEQPK